MLTVPPLKIFLKGACIVPLNVAVPEQVRSPSTITGRLIVFQLGIVYAVGKYNTPVLPAAVIAADKLANAVTL